MSIDATGETATCPNCGLKHRGIPAGREGQVHCNPARQGCGTRFDYPPTQRTVVPFRCSCDGSHYTITFKRTRASERYSIEKAARSLVCEGVAGPAMTMAFAMSEYNLTGFYCPCCGFSPDDNLKFVRCGKCNDLVCGAQTYDKLDDLNRTVKWYVCYLGCGGEGPITGTIESIGGATSRTTNSRAPALPSASGPLLIGGG